jgi:hypothetical protein
MSDQGPTPTSPSTPSSTDKFARSMAKFFVAIAAVMAALPAFISFAELGPAPNGPMTTMITAVVSIACYLTIALTFFYRRSFGKIFAWKRASGNAAKALQWSANLAPLILAVISLVSFVTYLLLINHDVTRRVTDPSQLDLPTAPMVIVTYMLGFIGAVGTVSLAATKEYYLAEVK